MNEETKTPEPLSAILAEMRKSAKDSYAEKTAKRLEDHEAAGTRDTLDIKDAIQCLRDDDRYLRDLADRIEVAVQRFVADDCAKCAHYNAATISLKDALDLANTITNHGINANDLADKASATIYALCHEVRTVRGEDANIKQEVQKLRRELRDLRRAPGNAAALREALEQAKRDHWFDMSPDLRNKIFAALSAPPEPPSNAASLREALEGIEDDCRVLDRKDMWEEEGECYYDALRDIREKVSAALAATARNCDVSRDTKETIERCLASLNVESSSASFDAGVCAAIGWMLAAPAEGGAE